METTILRITSLYFWIHFNIYITVKSTSQLAGNLSLNDVGKKRFPTFYVIVSAVSNFPKSVPIGKFDTGITVSLTKMSESLEMSTN